MIQEIVIQIWQVWTDTAMWLCLGLLVAGLAHLYLRTDHRCTGLRLACHGARFCPGPECHSAVVCRLALEQALAFSALQ